MTRDVFRSVLPAPFKLPLFSSIPFSVILALQVPRERTDQDAQFINGRYDHLQTESHNHQDCSNSIILTGNPSPSAASRPASERSVLLLHGPIGAKLPEAGVPFGRNSQNLQIRRGVPACH